MSLGQLLMHCSSFGCGKAIQGFVTGEWGRKPRARRSKTTSLRPRSDDRPGDRRLPSVVSGREADRLRAVRSSGDPARRARAKGETTPESGGVHLISSAGGDPRPLTFPRPPAYDGSPTFSADGRALAYASCAGDESVPACDVYVLPLDSELRPRTAARRLTHSAVWIHVLAWTRDGRSIVFGATGSGLWRVRADGGSPPERVELAGSEAGEPDIARSQDRLAFVLDIRSERLSRWPDHPVRARHLCLRPDDDRELPLNTSTRRER